VRCPASAGDDRLETAPGGGRGVFEEQVGRAVSGGDGEPVGNGEFLQGFFGLGDGGQIRGRAENNADQGFKVDEVVNVVGNELKKR